MLAADHKRFVFKIKTKSGGIVGDIVIEAANRVVPSSGFLLGLLPSGGVSPAVARRFQSLSFSRSQSARNLKSSTPSSPLGKRLRQLSLTTHTRLPCSPW